MGHRAKLRSTAIIAVALGLAACAVSGDAVPPAAQPRGEARIAIGAGIGLASLISLSDAHFQKMADSMEILAGTDAARSGAWERVRGPLAEVGKRNVAALNWFALPDGSYWSVQNGREAGNLSGRNYFPQVLGGRTVIGELVTSKAAAEPAAIVAVPVRGERGAVVGVLGASVYLDRLSVRLGREIGLDQGAIFYSFDRTGRFALDWDPGLIFQEPEEMGEKDVVRAVREMLSRERGMVSYRFRGKERTVLFRKSPVTGWWYVFGVVPGGREAVRLESD